MIHHINALAWIDPMSRTTSRPRSGGSRRRPALPPGKSPLPFPTEDHLLVVLDRGLGVFDNPARLIVWAFGQVCMWVATSVLARLCAWLFLFIAVKSYPMWPVWFHHVVDVIALVTA
jgi:hypothetical protein